MAESNCCNPYVLAVFKALGNYAISLKRDSGVMQVARARKAVETVRQWRLHRHVLPEDLQEEIVLAKWNDQVNRYLANHKLTVRAFFKRFDRDGDGQLDIKEVQRTIANIRDITLSLKEIKVLMKYWDSDKNGTVDYDVRSSYMIMLTLLKEFVNGLKYEHRKMRVSSVRRTLKKAPSFETSSPNVSDRTTLQRESNEQTLRRQRSASPPKKVVSQKGQRAHSVSGSPTNSRKTTPSSQSDRARKMQAQMPKNTKEQHTQTELIGSVTLQEMDASFDMNPIKDVPNPLISLQNGRPDQQEQSKTSADDLVEELAHAEKRVEELEDELAHQLLVNSDLDSQVTVLGVELDEARAETAAICALRNNMVKRLKSSHAEEVKKANLTIDELRMQAQIQHQQSKNDHEALEADNARLATLNQFLESQLASGADTTISEKELTDRAVQTQEPDHALENSLIKPTDRGIAFLDAEIDKLELPPISMSHGTTQTDNVLMEDVSELQNMVEQLKQELSKQSQTIPQLQQLPADTDLIEDYPEAIEVSRQEKQEVSAQSQTTHQYRQLADMVSESIIDRSMVSDTEREALILALKEEEQIQAGLRNALESAISAQSELNKINRLLHVDLDSLQRHSDKLQQENEALRNQLNQFPIHSKDLQESLARYQAANLSPLGPPIAQLRSGLPKAESYTPDKSSRFDFSNTFEQLRVEKGKESYSRELKFAILVHDHR